MSFTFIVLMKVNGAKKKIKLIFLNSIYWIKVSTIEKLYEWKIDDRSRVNEFSCSNNQK